MAITLTQVDLDEPVEQHLHQDFVRIDARQTVAEALAGLRRNAPPGPIHYFYVVDGQGRLEGVLPSRRMLLAAPDQPVSEIMLRAIVALPARATVLQAYEFFIQHRDLALPVIDDDRRLLGIVDVGLYIDEMTQLDDGRVRDDLFQLLGVNIDDSRRVSRASAFGRRFPWLGCNLAAGILAAFLCGVLQDELDRVVALAFFIPVVLNLAESVSSQSVSLALQALHGQPPSWRMVPGRLADELATGLQGHPRVQREQVRHRLRRQARRRHDQRRVEVQPRWRDPVARLGSQARQVIATGSGLPGSIGRFHPMARNLPLRFDGVLISNPIHGS
jgi:magnesium transporter